MRRVQAVPFPEGLWEALILCHARRGDLVVAAFSVVSDVASGGDLPLYVVSGKAEDDEGHIGFSSTREGNPWHGECGTVGITTVARIPH
jgi:hypothetical protein